MNLHPKAKPELTTSKDKARPILSEPWLDVADKPVLVACDGNSMVVIPVVVDPDDTTGPVSTEVLKLARKAKAETIKLGEMAVIAKANGETCATMPRHGKCPKDYPYPNFLQIYPAGTDSNRAPAIPKEGYRKIAFNPTLLIQIAEAMGSEGGITLHVPEDGLSVIFVEPNDRDAVPGARGLLMPMRYE